MYFSFEFKFVFFNFFRSFSVYLVWFNTLTSSCPFVPVVRHAVKCMKKWKNARSLPVIYVNVGQIPIEIFFFFNCWAILLWKKYTFQVVFHNHMNGYVQRELLWGEKKKRQHEPAATWILMHTYLCYCGTSPRVSQKDERHTGIWCDTTPGCDPCCHTCPDKSVRFS